MKKLIAITLCFVLCFSLICCKSAGKNSEEAQAALIKVLNKEKGFTFKSMVQDSVTEENLERFSFSTVYSARNVFSPIAYLFVDFDGDGVEELLIADSDLTFYLLLWYDGEQVYGNMLERVSSKNIGADGSFLIERSKQKRSVCKISFDGTECQIKVLANIDEMAELYQLDGKDVPKADVEDYFAEWNENTEKLTWEYIEQ